MVFHELSQCPKGKKAHHSFFVRYQGAQVSSSFREKERLDLYNRIKQRPFTTTPSTCSHLNQNFSYRRMEHIIGSSLVNNLHQFG